MSRTVSFLTQCLPIRDSHLSTLVCPGLQDIRDRYQGLFGEHAATMLQFMWQDDIRGVAMFIKECLGVHYGTDPDGVRHLISPRWLEKM